MPGGEYDSLRAELRSVARMYTPVGVIAADSACSVRQLSLLPFAAR